MTKLYFTTVVLFLTINLFSQETGSEMVDLSEIQLCEFTLEDLRNEDPDIIQVDIIEMNLCADGFIEDQRFENRNGYSSKKYKGVLFQKDKHTNFISKLRLTKDFKGKLPDGTYIDVSNLSAKDVIDKNPELDTWNSRGCSNFWSLTDKNYYFYVAIDEQKEPRYPIDKDYYLKKPVEGIDIISNCSKHVPKINPEDPLIILDGKEVLMSEIQNLKPEEVESVTVLKESATEIYGDKGKNGVIIIKTKANN